MNILLILFGKLVFVISQTLGLGHGSTWPGHIALLLNKKFIREILNKNQHLKIVLIAGTNGKTTTSKLIKFILEKNHKKVFLNETGANLLNGVASTLIKNSNLFGKLKLPRPYGRGIFKYASSELKSAEAENSSSSHDLTIGEFREGGLNYDVAIFEIDENTLPLILKEINPSAIAILNLFRDQLDRYGEVNTIAKKWIEALSKTSKETKLFLNGDDPLISFLGFKRNLNTYYFGINESLMSKKEIPHDVDSIYCPNCSSKLLFKSMSYSHLGDYECTECGFKRRIVDDLSGLQINYPLIGKYNIYNTNAAILVLNKIFDISINNINKYLIDFKPAFGRQEVIRYKNKNIIILLSKNPTGFNQSIETLFDYKSSVKNILIVINDRIPDGIDVSWIWDVDFENIINRVKKIFISGDRAYDMGIRFLYIQKNFQFPISNFQIEENLKQAVEEAVKKTKQNETLFILPTYSAMLEVRKILVGRKLSEINYEL